MSKPTFSIDIQEKEMKDVYFERLTKMVELLENVQKDAVKRDHFNLNTWARANDCGTVACACGHAGMDPWFNKQGFKLKNVCDSLPSLFPIFNSGEKSHPVQGWDAVVEFFGLNLSDAKRFFSFSSYPSSDYPNGVGPLDVAERIKEFLEFNAPIR